MCLLLILAVVSWFIVPWPIALLLTIIVLILNGNANRNRR